MSKPHVPPPASLPHPTRDERVVQNQGLVHVVARGFRGRGVEMEDVIQFGNLGLIRAAEKFEPERGLRFSTYAVYWIRQAMYKGIANTSRPIRVPLHARKEATAVHSCRASMEREAGRRPRLDEVLDAMQARGEVAPARRMRLLCAAEADVAKFGVKPLEEVLFAASGPTLESALIDAEHREQLGLALARLDDGHRSVLALRYGLDGSPPLDTQAVAALLGVSWRTATRMEREAIAKLKGFLRRGGPS